MQLVHFTEEGIQSVMSTFDQRPQLFRIVFGILAACLLIFSGYCVYQFGKSPSDENIFQNPPSRAYVIKAIRAERHNTSAARYEDDSIHTGDLLLTVNAKRFSS